MQTTGQPDNPNISVMIQETLKHLSKVDFKEFHFHLQTLHKPIPQGKLEDKDTMDTAKLMTGHYGSKALQVTKDILQEIKRCDLADELEKKMGKTTKANIHMNSELLLTWSSHFLLVFCPKCLFCTAFCPILQSIVMHFIRGPSPRGRRNAYASIHIS